MLLLKFLMLVAVPIVLSKTRQYQIKDAGRLFEEFIIKHDKKYAHGEEKKLRFYIFVKNLHLINKFNDDEENSAVYAINHFSDLTDEEKQLNLGFSSNNKHECQIYSGDLIRNVPEEWNWVQYGIVSKVKNQKPCYNCWAFSTTGNLEGQYAIKYKKLVEFSVQQLTDCDYTNGHCDGGGDMTAAFTYLKHAGGIISSERYPYLRYYGQCRAEGMQKVAKVIGCYVFDINEDEEKLKSILYQVGPISVGFAANDILMYLSGIVRKCDPTVKNHAALLVGYGQENGIPYWLFKNSWGENWGMGGYFKLERGRNMCGFINEDMSSGVIA